MGAPGRWFAALALVVAHTAQAAPPDAPGQYAATWPLRTPADASLLRLPLPAEVLTQVQTADLRDLRVFNAAGQAVPLALDRASAETRGAAPAPIELPALPILAEPAAAGPASLGLRIEDGPAGRVVRIDTAAPGSTVGAPAALTGALVDTRAQKAALQAIELDASWPTARPFTFKLHTSTDLRHWQALGEVTAYRGPDGGVTAPARVAVNNGQLESRYLRVTWDAAALPEAVQVRGVRLWPSAPASTVARVAVPLRLHEGATRDPRVIEWRMPFAAPVAALDIRAAGEAALIPVRVLVRQQSEQPWTQLARHVVFNLAQEGQTLRSPVLELGRATWRDWRLEADPSTPGFSAPPQITAWLASAQLVFVASGPPPFTLAVGRADAPRTELSLDSLIPGYQPGAQARLPAAELPAAALATPAVTAITSAPSDQRDLRRWTLWAVLVLGVLALGAMGWVLMRQLNKPKAGSID